MREGFVEIVYSEYVWDQTQQTEDNLVYPTFFQKRIVPVLFTPSLRTRDRTPFILFSCVEPQTVRTTTMTESMNNRDTLEPVQKTQGQKRVHFTPIIIFTCPSIPQFTDDTSPTSHTHTPKRKGHLCLTRRDLTIRNSTSGPKPPHPTRRPQRFSPRFGLLLRCPAFFPVSKWGHLWVNPGRNPTLSGLSVIFTVRKDSVFNPSDYD